MEKLDPKTDGASADLVGQNIEKLQQFFPDVLTEGKIDFDVLRETLGDYIDDRPERYSFTWKGKSRARRIAQTVSTGTLRPCPEESVHWDTTQHLFIEGDNLEVLKLLQKSYHKRVKLIYIDPPYNTGNEFIYPDKFADNLQTYLEYTGQLDSEGRRFSVNAEFGGRYHTNWLNMMYPRLKLSRNLLREDGAIWISIDDIEIGNLRHVCNEIFGEENFVATFIWEKRKTRENRRVFSFNHDYVVCYAREKDAFQVSRNMLPLSEEALARYKNPDNDYRGNWQSVSLNAQAGHGTAAQFYEIITPAGRKLSPPAGRCWSVTRDRLAELIADNRIYFGEEGQNAPRLKVFESEAELGLTPHTLWTANEVGTTDSAKRALISLFGGHSVFETPKPVDLLRRIAQISMGEKDIALDFFAGCAPLSEAILSLNGEDGGHRAYIAVQLPESCEAASDAFKAGFNNIAEIGKERIRRVIEKINAERPAQDKQKQENLPGMEPIVGKLDLGFKVFKLDASNIKPWDGDFDNVEASLFDAIENIKPDRSEEDVLYELLLKYGLDLAAPIEERTIDGGTVYIIGAGALVVCLAAKIGLEIVEGIAALKDELEPEVMRVVFKDAGFEDDVVKTNAVQMLSHAGIDDVKSL